MILRRTTPGQISPRSLGHGASQGAEFPETSVAVFDPRGSVTEHVELIESGRDGAIDGLRRRVVVLMRAAGWLLDDLIDDPETQEVRRGDLQTRGGFVRFGPILPENGGTTFGRDDAVRSVLENEDPVGHG